jgi:non-ribosomal peptide synthetase-like protein
LDKQGLANDNPEAVRAGIARKNRCNLNTMGVTFLAHWFVSFVAVFVMFLSILYYDRYAISAILAGTFAVVAFVIAFFTLMERASLGFNGLQARNVTMYDPYFLFHERHWKFCGHPLNSLFHGTPFRNMMSRALGVRVGRMVFDDGANLYDKTLLEIGDFSNLNKACILQAHSLEEGLFKSDTVRIGNGCTIGADAFVHYGVAMGDGSTLAPNAFLMKGEMIPPGQTWQGNPASQGSATSRTVSTLNSQPASPSATGRKRVAEDSRKARTVLWRRLPEPQETITGTITNTMSGHAVAQREAVVGSILAPVKTSNMFNDQRTG